MITYFFIKVKQFLYELILGSYQRLRYGIANMRISKKAGSMEVFYDIYKKRLWKNSESVSGTGSTIGNTHHIRQSLPTLFYKYNINSMLDLPCGDFNWMRAVDLSKVSYIGGDLVSELIEVNNEKYGEEQKSFITLNLIDDKLPKTDLILVRDCLVHFSFSDIEKALINIKKSDSTYLLTTSFESILSNGDIRTGFWRPINLLMPPFNFPEPMEILVDSIVGKYGKKSLLMWRINDLPNGID